MSPDSHDDVVRRSFDRQVGLFSGPDSPFARRSEGELAWLEPLADDMLVLDVACGAGHACEVVAPQVRQVVGIDLTATLLDLGAARLREAGIANVLLQEGNAEALPFVDDSFDLVFCRAALHHIGDPVQAVAEMVRTCRVGGRVVLSDLIAPSAEETRRVRSAPPTDRPVAQSCLPRGGARQRPARHAPFDLRRDHHLSAPDRHRAHRAVRQRHRARDAARRDRRGALDRFRPGGRGREARGVVHDLRRPRHPYLTQARPPIGVPRTSTTDAPPDALLGVVAVTGERCARGGCTGSANHTLVGATPGSYPRPEMQRIHAETQAALLELLAAGRYRPTVSPCVAFDDVPAALTDLAERRTTGRVVVRIAD